jgi:hypothetical protein
MTVAIAEKAHRMAAEWLQQWLSTTNVTENRCFQSLLDLSLWTGENHSANVGPFVALSMDHSVDELNTSHRADVER